jgi:hypothetical protein
MAHDVFISYSVKDKPIADAICASIEADGIRCWIAPRDIAPGEDWPMAVTKAITESVVMVLVFSASSNSSTDVSRELFLAANSKLVIIPFKIENVEPEPGKQYYLARTHWLDAINPPTQEQIRSLIDCVKALLPVREPPTILTELPAAPPQADQTLPRAKKPQSLTEEPVSPKKAFWTRYLWIPVSLIGVVCIFALAFVVAALVFKPEGLKLPFLITHTPTSTPVTPTPTSLPTFTATPDFTFGTGQTGATLYAGPGEYYPEVTFVYGDVTIIGQAYACAWFKVISTVSSETGWASADQLSYKGKCSDVKIAEIPPTPVPLPTFTLIPTATNTLVPTSKPGAQGPVSNNCPAQSAMTIGNRTGAYADFKLVGPGTFYVSLPPDVNTSVPVCEGCYDVYILNGACGDSSGSMVFRLCDGFNGWIYCD